MLLLRDFGLPPKNRQAAKACSLLLDRGLRRDGGINYGTWAQWTGRGETCVTGMVLSILSYFEHEDDRLDIIAEHLLAEQMPDGGAARPTPRSTRPSACWRGCGCTKCTAATKSKLSALPTTRPGVSLGASIVPLPSHRQNYQTHFRSFLFFTEISL